MTIRRRPHLDASVLQELYVFPTLGASQGYWYARHRPPRLLKECCLGMSPLRFDLLRYCQNSESASLCPSRLGNNLRPSFTRLHPYRNDGSERLASGLAAAALGVDKVGGRNQRTWAKYRHRGPSPEWRNIPRMLNLRGFC
jgi:hypothetical protein